MNRTYFFKRIRNAVFGGRLTQEQVDGITKILDYRASNYPKMTDNQLAYLLATVTWETGFKMKPVREGGGEKYLRSKPYYPWVGEGLVQVTWLKNAKKYGAKKPGDLMGWPIALKAAFDGMTKGTFTSKKLSDYINDKKCDFVNARRIINGMDKAKLIAGFAREYQEAFKQAKQPVAV